MEINTWAQFVALTDEQRSEYTPEQLEELKTHITENEAKLSDDRQKEIEKYKKSYEDQKIRAEKAEGKNKDNKEKGKEKEKEDLKGDEISPKDFYALQQLQVPLEDFDEVVKASKLLGKSIIETLKDEMIKGILKVRKEHRDTANATDTTKNKSPNKTEKTDDEIMSEASKGNFPEKGSKEAENLFWARRGGRRK